MLPMQSIKKAAGHLVRTLQHIIIERNSDDDYTDRCTDPPSPMEKDTFASNTRRAEEKRVLYYYWCLPYTNTNNDNIYVESGLLNGTLRAVTSGKASRLDARDLSYYHLKVCSESFCQLFSQGSLLRFFLTTDLQEKIRFKFKVVIPTIKNSYNNIACWVYAVAVGIIII